MTLDEIRELIALVNETGVEELEVQRGDSRVRIRRAGLAAQEVVLPASAALAASANAAGSRSAPLPPATEPEREFTADPKLHMVKSPIVGTFYESPSPGTPPFVRVGEK